MGRDARSLPSSAIRRPSRGTLQVSPDQHPLAAYRQVIDASHRRHGSAGPCPGAAGPVVPAATGRSAPANLAAVGVIGTNVTHQKGPQAPCGGAPGRRSLAVAAGRPSQLGVRGTAAGGGQRRTDRPARRR